MQKYIERGKIQRQPCAVCGDRDVRPAWPNPTLPRAVKWLCRSHAVEQRENREAAVDEGIRQVKAQFRELYDAVEALPEAQRRVLYTEALGGLDGSGTEWGSLRFWLALRGAYHRVRSSQRLS